MGFCIYRCRDFNVVNLKFGPAEIGSSCVRSRSSVGFVGLFSALWVAAHPEHTASPTWVPHTLICDLKPTSNVTILLWSWEDRTLVIYSPVIDYCILQREEEEEKGRTWAERGDLTWQSLSLVILSSLQILVILFFFSPPLLILVPPFLSTSSRPLLVHFSPLMQIALFSLPYLRPASSTVEYALKNGGLWMLPATLD